MKLLFLTGSRGEWGYIRPIIDRCPDLGIEYGICATNMLLLPSYGSLIDEIEEQGYAIDERIYTALEGSNHYTMVKSLGVLLPALVDTLARSRPDWLILAGDRGEQLMGAVAGSFCYVPTAHIQAGERSGNIDGLSRHAIGKLAHLHFASNEEAADRLRRLGEEDFRVHNVGAPQLDELVAGDVPGAVDLEERYDVDLSEPHLLVLLHPVTEEYDEVDDQVGVVLETLSHLQMTKVWILPNNDAGADRIRHGILRARTADIHPFENLPRRDFLGFMKLAACMVGNSSAGLIEAPTYGLPAVNIGQRQRDRVRADNVIDVGFDAGEIRDAIERAMSEEFRGKLSRMTNPYGDGNSSKRILELLSQTRRDSTLLVKRVTY